MGRRHHSPLLLPIPTPNFFMLFHKFQALGNDFLIVRELELRAVTDDFEAFSKQICDRHFGAGLMAWSCC